MISYDSLTDHLSATQVIHQKPKKTLNEITKELCPVNALLFKTPHLFNIFLLQIFIFLSCVAASSGTQHTTVIQNQHNVLG